jgi:hypothetical protein
VRTCFVGVNALIPPNLYCRVGSSAFSTTGRTSYVLVKSEYASPAVQVLASRDGWSTPATPATLRLDKLDLFTYADLFINVAFTCILGHRLQSRGCPSRVWSATCFRLLLRHGVAPTAGYGRRLGGGGTGAVAITLCVY